GTCKLPGLAAASTLYEAHDAWGRPFAMVTIPRTNHHTVVLTSNADGASLVDSDQIDTWVAYWGHWLSQLAHEPRLVAASVTVEATPDTGERLRREVFDNIAPDAPELSKSVLNEVVDAYPVGSAQLITRIALTYTGAGGAAVGGRKSVEDMALDLGTRLPGLAAGLQMTGAGPARPLTGEEMAEAIRVAYDPSVAALLDQARTSGGSNLTWDDAGPIAHQENWDHYRHDGAFSITWSMSEAPRGEVQSNILSRLVSPHPDIVRKRVTLLYRPHDAATAAGLVERDRKDALFKAQQKKVIQARDNAAIAASDQSAREEAAGAGLVRFGLLATATVLDKEDLTIAAAAMDNLSAASRLRLRRVYGSQASAFAAALPLGLVLPNHLKVPQQIREAM
ncbi:MAG TPA: SCO6880 family protein, partial [Yinghuangia sp.]|nr:SCO6880 family protein [Yinghuangia sp.]